MGLNSEPNSDEIDAIIAPLRFLTLRANLSLMREMAEEVDIPIETLEELDRLLEKTNSATETLLLRTPMPDDDWLDEIFDDEFLMLCKAMRVNLLAWINQPQILLRLRDPDSVLSRFAGILEDMDDLNWTSTSTTASFVERVDELVRAINVTYQRLLMNDDM